MFSLLKKNIGNPPQTNPAAKWLKIIFQIFRFVSRRVILKNLNLGGWVICGNYMKRHDVDSWRAKETQTIPTFEVVFKGFLANSPYSIKNDPFQDPSFPASY